MNTATLQSTTLTPFLEGHDLTRRIPLANGKGFAIVDDEDYEWLSQYKWHIHSGRYAATTIYDGKSPIGRTFMMHRMILGEDSETIDHISGDGLDNRRVNIRRATRGQNGINNGPQKNNTSGFRGVSLIKNGSNKKWNVSVGSGKDSFKRNFDTLEEAVRARDEAARRLYGEFPQTSTGDTDDNNEDASE